MHWIQELRDKYGIQQIELAMFLDVSRSTISLTEINKRDLPTKAMIELLPFIKDESTELSVDIADKLNSLLAEDEALKAKQIQRALRNSQLKLIRAQRKLETMQTKYQQALNALQLATRLQALPVESTDEHKNMFVEGLLAIAYIKIKENGKAAQQPIIQTININEAYITTNLQ